ncbi:hypothetical protein [Legionella oakridgensis]|uniref:Uncharacterized protein n=2 Tax=Legionella oakridgensis TaxID=29423 RepID=W0BC77_9GAMM|nr:hypothetical protein [Legionella oakridgensis]AHE66232.1 hypothetical protein Loa_00663 [Legionella oakridgensis ATCC 33761 = DSM 21215]ETO93950.1 hypothetical protein LOR_88c24650 [Legionella oakridgensis RV-2-2007]KTD44771.1 hypothetical protein Loak_0020 [Legionella oakridgensis]STY16135.1 Uncharacterised protein [Legionella longbeachae]
MKQIEKITPPKDFTPNDANAQSGQESNPSSKPEGSKPVKAASLLTRVGMWSRSNTSCRLEALQHGFGFDNNDRGPGPVC